jgi:hypothetical protein
MLNCKYIAEIYKLSGSLLANIYRQELVYVAYREAFYGIKDECSRLRIELRRGWDYVAQNQSV